VRETVSKIINIDNPLDIDIEIKKDMLTSDNENIQFNPPFFTVPAHSVFFIKNFFYRNSDLRLYIDPCSPRRSNPKFY
jgi:hypothetical protein